MSDGVEVDRPEVARRDRRVRWWQWLLPTVGGVALATGIALLAWVAAHPASFGWFAYAPLSDTTFVSPAVARSELGDACLVFGLIVLAFWAGLLVGRRSRR